MSSVAAEDVYRDGVAWGDIVRDTRFEVIVGEHFRRVPTELSDHVAQVTLARREQPGPTPLGREWTFGKHVGVGHPDGCPEGGPNSTALSRFDDERCACGVRVR